MQATLPKAKPATQSKTMWTNLAAPVLSWVLSLAGIVVPTEVQIALLSVLNIGLRKISNTDIDSWF